MALTAGWIDRRCRNTSHQETTSLSGKGHIGRVSCGGTRGDCSSGKYAATSGEPLQSPERSLCSLAGLKPGHYSGWRDEPAAAGRLAATSRDNVLGAVRLGTARGAALWVLSSLVTMLRTTDCGGAAILRRATPRRRIKNEDEGDVGCHGCVVARAIDFRV